MATVKTTKQQSAPKAAKTIAVAKKGPKKVKIVGVKKVPAKTKFAASTTKKSLKSLKTASSKKPQSGKNPKFSVLMSIYKNDNPEHLALALKSIYEDQTLKPNQIVIVLDGPVPASIENVIAKFSEDKKRIVELVKLKKNSGLGNALRTGSEHCKNDYIMRMDADDISEQHRFAKQIDFIKTHPEVDVLGGNISEFQAILNDEMRQRIVPKTHSEIAKMAKVRNPMNHMTVCIKKKALEEVGNYEPCPYLEDYYLWVRMIVKGYKFANLPATLVYARVGNGFTARRSNKDQLTGRKIMRQFMLKNNIINNREAIRNAILSYGLVYLPAGIKNLIYKKVLRRS